MAVVPIGPRASSRPKLRSAVAERLDDPRFTRVVQFRPKGRNSLPDGTWSDCPQGLSSSTGCPVSHSSLPVALLASNPPCGSFWAAPKAPLGPRFPSGQFATLTRREKGFDCPFRRRGLQCRAQRQLDSVHQAFGARSCSPFSAVKMGGLFPLRCLSPLCSSAGGARRTKPMQVAMSWHRLDGFAEQKNRLVFLLWLALSIRKQRRLGYFNNWIPATQKANWISYPRWPF